MNEIYKDMPLNIYSEFPKDPINGDVVIKESNVYAYDSKDSKWLNAGRIGPCNEVIKFIKDFKNGNEKVLEDVFLHGYCYWFAKILAERFNGTIVYNPIDNHFACRIGSTTYDISGEINGNSFIKIWSDYKKIDPYNTDRIMRDCILKIDGNIDYENHTCNGTQLKIFNVIEE